MILGFIKNYAYVTPQAAVLAEFLLTVYGAPRLTA